MSSSHTRLKIGPMPGTDRRRSSVCGSCDCAAVMRWCSRSRMSRSSSSTKARSTAMCFCTAGSEKRWATASRGTLDVSGWPHAGTLAWLFVCRIWVNRSARWRTRCRRRRSKSRVARIVAGYAEACGNMPPRSHTAIFWASRRSCLALPPWIAFIYWACPSTNVRPSWTHRSASQYQGNMHSTVTTRSWRSGAMALRKVSGVVGIFRWRMISPSRFKIQTYIVRACRSMPQYASCTLDEVESARHT